MIAPSVTTPREGTGVSAEPFDLPGGPDAALLLHGLTGSPHEVRFVAGRLHALGLRCRAPLLAGHGGRPAALGGIRWQAWVEGACAELQVLRGARRVLLVGCSMGALVACAIAHREPRRVCGLALLAPALRLRAPGRAGAWLGRLPFGRSLQVAKAAGSDVRDPEERRRNPGLAAVPLGAVAELAGLARHVDGLLPEIHAPALVVAARHDHTVAMSGAKRMMRRLAGPVRSLVLERSFHLVGIDVEREACAAAVAALYNESTAAPAGEG